ncbi:MAG: DUF721 domain-containing protein [Nitrospirae bacterium]|nr:DUF721 domain-containing protein [Nitrospirota bacterium]
MSYPLPIASILKPLLKKYGLEAQMQVYTLIDRWEKIAGHQIASHTLPYQLKFKKLYLYVDSSVWMNHLNYLREELKGKINREMGEPIVKEISLKIGPVEKNKEVEEEARPVRPVDRLRGTICPRPIQSPEGEQSEKALSREEIEQIEQYVGTLEEKDLREQVKKFFIRGALNSKKKKGSDGPEVPPQG